MLSCDSMNPGPFFLGWCFLMSFIPTARLCLQCDSVIRNMHEDFISSRTKITVQQQMDLKNIVDHAYVTYQDTSRELSGVIDPTTLYRAQTEYQSEFRRHWQKPNTDSIQSHMTKIVEKGKRILKKHLNIFVEEGLCPNKCGLLFQSVMDCSTCKYTLHTCQSETPPKDCGGQRLEAGETEQVVLDCYLPWHSLVVGKPKYYYFWKQGARNFTVEDRFEILVVTQDSKIVLNQLSVSEQGVYRCFLLDRHGITLSHMHFILTVIPLPSSSPSSIPTLPSLPSVDFRPVRLHRDTLIITLAVLTALSLSASLVIILHTGIMARRETKNRERHDDQRENSQEETFHDISEEKIHS